MASDSQAGNGNRASTVSANSSFPAAVLSSSWGLALAVALYGLHGWLAIPLTGLQYDELLHLPPILPPVRIFGFMSFGETLVPTMILPYLGCLKTWLAWPFLGLTEPSTAAIRIPAILVGAAALAVTWRVLRPLAGAGVATLVVLLAAVDTTFVLCTTYDWGPVGLQLLLVSLAALAALRFHDSGRVAWAAMVGLCAGLAIWNKALALWIFGALGLTVLVFAPFALRRWWRAAPLVAALVCFVLGAFPFLAWNKKMHWATFRENGGIALSGLAEKAPNAWSAFDGSQFLGYMIRGEIQDERGPASQELPWLRSLRQMGWRFGNGNPCALLLALPLGCWLLRGQRLRLWLAALLAMAVAMFQMMITNGAGTGMHHYVLLFPLPFLVIAMPLVALAESELRRRKLAVIGIVLLLSWSAISLHSSFAALRGWGPTNIWSTAINDLTPVLRAHGARQVFALDWGIDSQLRYLLWPEAQADLGYEFLEAPTMPDNIRDLHLARLRSPSTLYVAFQPRNAIVPIYLQKFREFAAREGFREERVADVNDAWGEPMYRVMRFRPVDR